MKSILVAFAALLPFSLPARSQTFAYSFGADYQGWTADFADYPVKDSVNWHLRHGIDTLPDIRPKQSGLVIIGDNFSDDLFLWAKRKITGLSPNTSYTLVFAVEVATEIGRDMVGGGDLTLKAGATILEPRKIDTIQPGQGGTPYFRMNIDKSNQSQPGKDMDTLGHVQHSFTDGRTHLVTMGNATHPFKVKTGPTGDLWLIVGAESAFETSGAALSLASIRATLTSKATALGRNRASHPGFHDPSVKFREWTCTGRKLAHLSGEEGVQSAETNR